jgi:hypothetical protein
MADAGSQQILDLLNQPSELLQANGLKFAKALRHSPGKPYGVPAQSGFDALAEIRQYYRELRAQIDAVETADPSKQQILDGLDDLDRSIGAFETGLSHGLINKAERKARRSKKLAVGAKKALRRGMRGLST